MAGVADMVLSTVGGPDAYIREHWRQHRRQLKRAWWISVSLSVGVVGIAVVVFVGLGVPWWLFFIPGVVVTLLAIPLGSSFDPPDRPRPESPREIAVVVGVTITSWGSPTDDQHTYRIIARPVGSATDALVHCYSRFPTDTPCPVRAAMVIGFRRFPTMRHLVWLDDSLTRIDAARMRLGGQFSAAAIETGEVAQIEVLASTPVGDWWLTRTTLCADDGSLPTENIHRLPEELAELEPGAIVQFVRDHGECVILPSVPRIVTAATPPPDRTQ